jgi:arylsulfatase A-like enzyme
MPPPQYRSLFGDFASELVPTSENLVPLQDNAHEHLGTNDVEFLKAMYDGEIRYTDDRLQWLFEQLHEAGFLDNALVLITADHGEEFMDHGGLLHRVSLYEELMRVPLIITGCGVPDKTVDNRLVSLVDLAPTILAAAGVEAPETMEGRDLLARGNDDVDAVFAQYADDLYAVRTHRWKLIEHTRSGEVELYDLDADPGEIVNLASRRGRHVRRLGKRLAQWRESLPALDGIARPEAELTQDEIDRLKELGYLQ